MIMRQKLHIDASDRQLELGEPDGRAPPGVDQELLGAGFDQRTRPEAVGVRDRHAGPEQRHPEAGGHGLILMLASRMTLDQRAISPFTSAPKASGRPPPTSVPTFASASRTLSVSSALLIAALSRAITAGGVPALTRTPAQSSDASCG